MTGQNYNLKEFQQDYDWQCAFYEAMNGTYGYGFDLDFITRIICCDEGENDERDWIAVVEIDPTQVQDLDLDIRQKFAVMAAGCDYTGWDCQASGVIDFYETEGEALTNLTPDQMQRLNVKFDNFYKE